MTNFINIEDYDASIHRDILDALTREDASLVEICEDRAIAEMRCYLSGRYDCEAIFSALVRSPPPFPLMSMMRPRQSMK